MEPEIPPEVAAAMQVPPFKFTKSHARRVLSKFWLKPEFLNRTTKEDEAKGEERFQILYTGAYGARRKVMELNGPKKNLPTAALYHCLKLLGFDLEFVTLFTPKGPKASWRIVPTPKKEQAAPEVEASPGPDAEASSVQAT